MPDALSVVHVYPELLGTYGDRGNVLALAHRARARGLEVRVVDVSVDEPIPASGDLYVLGGGEDSAQVLAARCLFADDGAAAALSGSAPVLAVCAGLQLLSTTFQDADGRPQPGLGLIDVTCERLPERAVGEIVIDPIDLPGVPTLTGYENHRGTAVCGPAAKPLGFVRAGVGNGDTATEGAQQGSVIATYLHGPVLVRNPALADVMLARAVGELAPYDHEAATRLHAERLDAVDPRRRPRVGRMAGLRARLSRR